MFKIIFIAFNDIYFFVQKFAKNKKYILPFIFPFEILIYVEGSYFRSLI